MPATTLFIILLAVGALLVALLVVLLIFVFTRFRLAHDGPNIGLNQDDPSVVENLEHLGIILDEDKATLYVRSRIMGDERTLIVIPYVNGKPLQARTYTFGGVSEITIGLPKDTEGAYVEAVEGGKAKVWRRLLSGVRTTKIVGYGLLVGLISMAALLALANAFEVNATAIWHMQGYLRDWEYLMFVGITYAPLYGIVGLAIPFLLGAAGYMVPMFILRGKAEQKGGF